MKSKKAGKSLKKPSLCWDCQKATGGCEWSAEFKAVDGWAAEEAVIVACRRVGNQLVQEKTNSFHVIECPKFEKDDECRFGRFLALLIGRTPAYELKEKLMQDKYGVTIREV